PVAGLDDAPMFGSGAGTATATVARPDTADPALDGYGYDDEDDQPWHIAREKVHPAEPMTVDDALHNMELVGHDFYLFLDKESGRPSVIYRRRGYDYGIIALEA
ncbi:sigma 54 modulation/S30EA ribosomal C-terminal domain-containing protein, partial [Micromonospora zhanjiangensis]